MDKTTAETLLTRLCIGCGHDERIPVVDVDHPNALACCPDHDYRTPGAVARYARDLVPDARALVEGWILDFLRTARPLRPLRPERRRRNAHN